MNTIYDGSFVLGQTSATNFQAGPGISITQPSEGTVRIANDETVLWSGNNATTLNLSEPATSFNTVKVYYGNSASFANNVINGCYEFTPLGNYVGIHSCFVGNSANKSTYTVHTIWSGINTNTWSRIYYAYKNMDSTGWNTDSNWQNIIKVVGINRKEV